MRRRFLIPVALTALAAAIAPDAAAQDDRTVIQVTDVRGNAIPFALVQIVNGVGRVADDSGRAIFNIKPKDSLNIQARRIGFQPYIGWVKRNVTSGLYVADLPLVPRSLDPVTISGRRDTPLARTGIIGGLQIEVDGVAEGATIVAGPIQTLRELRDGDRVQPARGD